MKFEDLLLLVDKPARYTGGEYGIPDMKPSFLASTCMVFPDTYEVGMSNLGIKILYNILNLMPDVVCERCFAPWIDMGKLLKENNVPLMSLETKRNLCEFDLLGFSLQYELLFSNVLYILDLAQIPFYAKDRGGEFPIILGGGPCSANPEPMADFFDLFCIGEGEEVIQNIVNVIKKNKGNKSKILNECSKIVGVYVPTIHLDAGKTNEKLVTKAVVKDLNSAIYPVAPIVPNISVVHDRPVAELYRGCFSSCRFCQASFFYRPIRKRSPEVLHCQIKQMIENTGCEEIGISSLSTGDYPELSLLFDKILPEVEGKKVKLQLPSLRLDSFTPELVRNTRKTGSLTFAPEAGTQRLRNVINKNISDEDIDRTMKMAFESGYRRVKLYFMVGLPSETEEDLLGIIEIVQRVKRIYRETMGRNDIIVNVSAAVFVPKPVTPFQWVEQISMDEMKRRLLFVRNELKKIKGTNYSWSDERISFLEAVFARGDKKLAALIEAAYLNGAKFDSWNEHFNFEVWDSAGKELGLDLQEYIREKDISEVLPWGFIDFGVSDTYFKSEFFKSKLENTSEGCKVNCQGCGANKLGRCSIGESSDNDKI